VASNQILGGTIFYSPASEISRTMNTGDEASMQAVEDLLQAQVMPDSKVAPADSMEEDECLWLCTSIFRTHHLTFFSCKEEGRRQYFG
jgi:hypothetical protein